MFICINPLPHMPIFDSSNSTAKKYDVRNTENGDTLSDSEENIAGKEEIARYEQFLLFPQGFQKLPVVDA